MDRRGEHVARFLLKDKKTRDTLASLEYDVSKAYGVLSAQIAVVPDQPEGLMATTVTATSATVVCDPAANAEWYQWYLDGVPYRATTEPLVLFSGLEGNRQYSVLVEAVNAAGTSRISLVLAFTTVATQPPVWGPVPAQQLVVGTPYSLDLAGYVLDPDTQPASLAYSVVSGTLPDGLTRTGSVLAGTPTAAGTLVVTFRVSDGGSSADVAVTFAALAPDTSAPSVPTNFAAMPYSTTQVRLTWVNPAGDAVVAGQVTSGLSHVGVYRDGAFVGQVLHTAQPNDEYMATTTAVALWKIRAADLAGNRSAFTAEISAGPLADVPDAPDSFAVTRTSGTSARLDWRAPLSGAAATSYRVYFSLTENGTYAMTDVGLPTPVGGVYSYTQASGFSAAQEPWFYVTAVSGGVEGAATLKAKVPAVVITVVHEDDFGGTKMRSSYAGTPGFGPGVPQTATDYDPANARWNVSAAGDLCYNKDAFIHTSTAHVRSPAYVSRSARVQLSLDRASDNNGKIERNEIIAKPYTGSGSIDDLAMMRGSDYWLGFSLLLPGSGAEEWIRSNIYVILFQMKAAEFIGGGVDPLLSGPHFTIGPDYGYKSSEGGIATQWRVKVSGYTGQSSGSGEWDTVQLAIGNVEADKGHWVDWVIHVIPEYRPTWVDAQGVKRYATTEIWKDDVKVLERIGFSNCVYNSGGQAYVLKTGVYNGFANAAYTSGPQMRSVHYLAERKHIQITAGVPGIPADTSHPGYLAVKPRGLRTEGF